ncbi:MAG TPA: NUDIX domain-containing protein [Aquabacterium sp.]|uniref:NUDIX domain-containing protein n=1 Tax=Aquabacterium sp. TaxID=1872578 RepID=UPI002E33D1E7|nr:NUDIX domain-containing protein [Aquabacterium sp.]HEX5357997.1 NUDIX domain-containing protein [Aquabacterium sp.]
MPTIVVIARNPSGHILLVHDRDSDNWTLPGGIIEPGETPADAAVREVWEETRVVASLTHIVGVAGGPGCETHYRNGDKIAWVATIFGANVADGTPIADGSETTAARFVSPEELKSLSLRADTIRFLGMARDGYAQASFQPATWHPD